MRTGIFSNQFLLKSRGFTRGFEDIGIADSAGDDGAQTALEVTANALRFIDDYSPERFFLYAHYVEPHQPYAPSTDTTSGHGVNKADVSVAELSAKISAGHAVTNGDPRVHQLTARYDAEIIAVDQAIEALVAGLSERGLADNTLIIVTGSQGQEFLEHGYLGHAWTLYEELLRVPLILHAPGLIDPQRVEGAVSTIEIYPTLVELFDLDLDTGLWQLDGSSFLSATLDVRVPQDPMFAELVIRERCIVRAVVLNEWKYIADYLPCAVEDRQDIQSGYLDLVTAIASGEADAPPLWGEIQQEVLFNLNDDPGETVNRAADESEQLEYMRSRLEEYQQYAELNALRAIEASAPRNMDAAQRDRLCGGGYFGC